jgi:hypothetical protein
MPRNAQGATVDLHHRPGPLENPADVIKSQYPKPKSRSPTVFLVAINQTSDSGEKRFKMAH